MMKDHEHLIVINLYPKPIAFLEFSYTRYEIETAGMTFNKLGVLKFPLFLGLAGGAVWCMYEHTWLVLIGTATLYVLSIPVSYIMFIMATRKPAKTEKRK